MARPPFELQAAVVNGGYPGRFGVAAAVCHAARQRSAMTGSARQPVILLLAELWTPALPSPRRFEAKVHFTSDTPSADSFLLSQVS